MAAMSGMADLRRLAAQQHGLLATRQVYERGVTRGILQHAVRSGAWERVTTRVIGLVGRPETGYEAAMIAALHHGPDAFVSGPAALALWRVPGFDLSPVQILSRRPISRRSTTVGCIRTTTDLLDSHITVVREIPVVTPVRAIFDIAGVLHPKRVERALDNAWTRRLLNGSLLRRIVLELGKRGRPGTVLMRELTDARPVDFRPTESSSEARTNEILVNAGQRPLRRQVNAGTEDRWVGRFDLADTELPLILEVHSELFHGSKLDQERDAARRVAMTAAGWTFLEAWENEVWRQPDIVVARVANARRTLRRAA